MPTDRGQSVEVIVQNGHAHYPRDAVFSRDGNQLFTCGNDGLVIEWDLVARRKSRQLQGAFGPLYRLCLSPDESELSAAGLSGTIYRWRRETGAALRTLAAAKTSHESWRMAYSPDAQYFAANAGTAHGTDRERNAVRVWSVEAPYIPIAIIATDVSDDSPGEITGLAFTRQSDGLLIVGKSRAILIHVPTGKLLARWVVPDGVEFYRPAYSPSGDLLAMLDATGNVAILDTRSMSPVRLVEAKCSFCGWHGEDLWTHDPDGLLVFWNARSGEPTAKYGGHQHGQYSSSAVHPGLRRRALFKELDVVVEDIETETVVVTFGRVVDMFMGSLERQMVVCWGSASTFVEGGLDGTVRVVDLSSSARPRTIHTGLHRTTAIKLSNDGRLIAIANAQAVRVLGIDGETQFETSVSSSIDALSFHPSARLLASAVRGAIGTGSYVAIWDLCSGVQVGRAQLGGDSTVHALSFSPQGDRLIAVGDRVGLISLRSKELDVIGRLDLAGKQLTTAAAFSETGDTVAVVSGLQWLSLAMLGSSAAACQVTVCDVARMAVLSQCRVGDARTGVQSIAFHPERGQLILGEGDGAIRVIDAASGRTLRWARKHGGPVDHLAVSPSGKHLVSASQDQSVRIWDLERFDSVAVLICLPNDDFAFVTEDGYYAASPSGLRSVAFRVDGVVVPAELQDAALNRPDLVLERLGYATSDLLAVYRAAWSHRMRKLGLRPDDLATSKTRPALALATPVGSSVAATRKLPLRIRVTPGNEPVERVLLSINGCSQPVSIENGDRSADAIESDVDIVLEPGLNTLRASAIASDGVRSFPVQREIVCSVSASIGKLFVAVVGVSNYRDARLKLKYAAKDAQDVARVFASASNVFSAVEVQELLDQKVNRDRILELRGFFERAGIDDTVVLFVAGHGLLDPNGSYWFLPADVDVDAPVNGAVAYEELEQLLDGIATRRRLILIDTCNAGDIDRNIEELLARSAPQRIDLTARKLTYLARHIGAQTLDAARLQRLAAYELRAEIYHLYADMRNDSGTLVMTASAGADLALESAAWQNGAFTLALREAIEGRMASTDGGVSVTLCDLQRYIARRVRTLTLGFQVPHLRRGNVDLNFPLVFDQAAEAKRDEDTYKRLAEQTELACTGQLIGTAGAHRVLSEIASQLDQGALRDYGGEIEELRALLVEYLEKHPVSTDHVRAITAQELAGMFARQS